MKEIEAVLKEVIPDGVKIVEAGAGAETVLHLVEDSMDDKYFYSKLAKFGIERKEGTGLPSQLNATLDLMAEVREYAGGTRIVCFVVKPKERGVLLHKLKKYVDFVTSYGCTEVSLDI